MKLKCALFIVVLFLALPLKVSGLTVEEEKKYGKEAYMQIAQSVPLNDDVYMSLYLRTMTDRLQAVTNLDMPIFFSIIDYPAVDAFASIGGYVFITTGLIAMTESEEELAGVLAHEFAHISKRHVSKAMEKQKIANWGTLATLIAAALIPSPAGKSAILATGLAGAQQVAITYTRENEEEADAVGAANADRAGYGGLGTAEFLKKLRATSDNRQVPRYLLTHPYHSERITRIEQDWKGSKCRLDTSFYPFLVARAQILHGTPGLGIEEIWINKYKKDNENPVNAYGAALVYSLKGEGDEAVRIMSAVKSPYKNLFLGEMLVNARRFREAIDLLKDETNPIARYFLARAYEGNGDRELAVTTYKSMFRYADSFPELFKKVGMVSGMMGNEGEGYENLGRYYLINGNMDQARISFEKAVNKYGINTKQAREVMNLLDKLPKKGSGPR
jgi:beta-barrel assembly-enhancing protease